MIGPVQSPSMYLFPRVFLLLLMATTVWSGYVQPTDLSGRKEGNCGLVLCTEPTSLFAAAVFLLRAGSDEPQVVEIPLDQAAQVEKACGPTALLPRSRRPARLPVFCRRRRHLLHLEAPQADPLLDGLDQLGVRRKPRGVGDVEHVAGHPALGGGLRPRHRQPVLPEGPGDLRQEAPPVHRAELQPHPLVRDSAAAQRRASSREEILRANRS